MQQLPGMVKLSELESPALPSARQVRLGRNTASRLYMLMRRSLSRVPSPRLAGEVEADESCFGGKRKGRRGRGAAGKDPVFGSIERGGLVAVHVVPNVSAELLVGLTVKSVRKGSLVYTDKFSSYNAMAAYGFRHRRIDHSRRFANGKVFINGNEGYWNYAKQRLAQHHGVSKHNFHLYLKEMEVRYNFREDDFFGLTLWTVWRESPSLPTF